MRAIDWANENLDRLMVARTPLERIVEAYQAGQRDPIVTLPIQGVTHNLPDRRAELLELASRLATASRVAWLESRTAPGRIVGIRTVEQAEADTQRAREYHASDTVAMAAAIIAEVDRVSGDGKHG